MSPAQRNSAIASQLNPMEAGLWGLTFVWLSSFGFFATISALRDLPCGNVGQMLKALRRGDRVAGWQADQA